MIRYACAISDNKSTILTGGLGYSDNLVTEYNQTVGMFNIEWKRLQLYIFVHDQNYL